MAFDKPDICYNVNQSDPKELALNASVDSSSKSSGVGNSDPNMMAESIDITVDNRTDDKLLEIRRNSVKEFNSRFNHQTPFMESTARISALFWKNITRLRRNMAVLLFQFLLPSIEVILFCTCIGQHPFDIPVAVFNEEQPAYLSAMFLNAIDNKTILQVHHDSYDSAIQAVKNGDAWAALVIGKNFSTALQQRYSIIN